MIKSKIKLTDLLISGLFCIGVFLMHNASAQEATLSRTLEIKLDESLELQEHYIIDADEFGFESQQEALNYFKDVKADFVAIRPQIPQGKVHIYLQRKQKPNWDLDQWNSYLSKILESKLTTNSTITNE